MIYIDIIHGPPCVGKTQIMNRMAGPVNKLEMDSCRYWLFNPNKWTDICINHLIEHIIQNLHKMDMVVTCGALPPPEHDIYLKLKNEYSVHFIHTLVLAKNIDEYKKNIQGSGRKHDLINEYMAMEETLEKYSEIIYH